MSNFFFDLPWYVPAILAVAGIAAAVAGNARQNKQLMYGGVAAVLVALLATAVSYFINTPRELAIARTQGIVQSVEERNWDRFSALIGTRATVVGLLDAQAAVQFVRQGVERADIQALAIRNMQVTEQPDAGAILVDITVLGTAREAGLNETSWRLTWGVSAQKDVVLVEVEPTNLPEGVQRMVERLRRN